VRGWLAGPVIHGPPVAGALVIMMDGAVAAFSDGASLTYVVDPAPPGQPKAVRDATYDGKEEIHSFLADNLAGFKAELSEPKVEQDRITARAKLRSEAWRRMGLEEVDFTLDALVQGGKLSTLTLTAAEPSSRRLVAAIPQDAKATVRRFIEQVNRKNMAVLDDTVSRSFAQHSVMPVGPGLQGLKDFYKSFRSAFPDFQFTIDDMIAEGDQVAVRMTCRYTHKGEFMGIAPTGKPVVVMKMDVFRVVNGKVVEHWDAVDRLGLLQQLGVVPKIPQWTTSPTTEGFR